MELSKETILHKKFKRSFKGYDDLEVDQFLDELTIAIEEMKKENARLKEEAERFKEMEATVANSIVFAQQTAEGLLNDEKEQAQALRENAQQEIDVMKAQAQSEAELVKQQYLQKQGDLVKRVEEFQQFADQYQRDILEMIDKQKQLFEETCLTPRETPETIAVEEQEELTESEQQTDEPEEKEIDIQEMVQSVPDDEEQLKAAIDEIIS